MKSISTRRILSLIVALAMMIVPMSMGASAAELISPTDDKTPAKTAEFLERSANIRSTEGLEVYDPPVSYIRGLPGGIEQLPLIAGDSNADSAQRSYKISDGGQAVGSKRTFYDNNNGGTFGATVVAASRNTVVYLADSALGNDKIKNFAENDVLSEFDGLIYGLVTGIVGEPYFSNYRISNVYDFTDEKVNIVLYDINRRGGLLTAGFFSPNDFMKRTGEDSYPRSNEGAIVYLDISSHYGQEDIEGYGGVGVLGTLAHEFQHLVNHTYILKNFGQLPKGYQSRNTWLNEGLSGLVEKEYFAEKGLQMEESHLTLFLGDVFASGVGYVPTDDQWVTATNASGSTPYIIANYGSTSVVMQEYYATGGNVAGIVDSSRIGYANSLADVGSKSKQGSFNEFFKDAVLATGVSTPSGIWRSAVGINLWQKRYDVAGDGGFIGAKSMAANGLTFNSGGRTYYSQVFLSEPIGDENQYVSFTLPANAKGDYYLVTATDPSASVSSAAEWIKAEKAPIKIVSGEKLEIGVNNRFAVVAISYGATVNETLAFNYIETDRPPVTVNMTQNPDPLVSGEGGTIDLSVSVAEAVTQDMALEITAVDENGTVVSGISGSSITIPANQTSATGSVTVNDRVPAGIYKIKAEDTSDAKGAIGYTEEFQVRFKLELASPDTLSAASLTEITVNAIGAEAIPASGVFTLDVDGVSYSATISGATPSGSWTIPLSSFRNGSGALLIPYGATVELFTEEGSMKTASGVTSVSNGSLGSFVMEGEPAFPSTIPGRELTFSKTDGYANFLVYFGDNTGVTEANITSSDSAVVTVDPETVTGSGTSVRVNAHKAGSATLTIGFSGDGLDSENPDLTCQLNVTVTGTNPGGGIVIGGGGNLGGGGGSTSSGSSSSSGSSRSSSSGGGGGGGGGGGSTVAASPFNALTTAQASNKASSAIAEALKTPNASRATARFTNISDVSLETMKSMADLAKKAGVTLTVHMDTVVNGKVVLRQSFNPAEATKPVKFGGSTTSVRAVNAKALFKKYYSNTVEVIALNQQEDFGMRVETAVPSTMFADSTVIYSHNGKTNQFKALSDPKTWKDTNGYMHFGTSMAYNIVLSQGKLSK